MTDGQVFRKGHNFMPNTVPGDIYPGLKKFGYCLPLDLSNVTSTITTVTTGLDTYIVPAWLPPSRLGPSVFVAGATITLEKLGTGATSGNWSVALVRVSDGAVLGTALFAYNAANGVAINVDMRDSLGNGAGLLLGDSIRLDVTGIPAGTPTGIQGVKAHISCKHFGIRA
jgi:hypothetical protein